MVTPNGQCFDRQDITDETPEEIQKLRDEQDMKAEIHPNITHITRSCVDGFIHYEGFDSHDCTGAILQTHEESVRPGCDGKHRQKCISTGYLVHKEMDSMYESIDHIDATPMERCFVTSHAETDGTATYGSSKFSDLHKSVDYYMSTFSYNEFKYDNTECRGEPIDELEHETMSGYDYSFEQNLKDALNLGLYKVKGNKEWNDWYQVELYDNDMCEGAPKTIRAGSSGCSGMSRNVCDDHGLHQISYSDMTCGMSTSSTLIRPRDCEWDAYTSSWTKVQCHTRGQAYHDMH